MEQRYDALEKERDRREMEKPGKKEAAAARKRMSNKCSCSGNVGGAHFSDCPLFRQSKSAAKLEELVLSDRLPEEFEEEANGLISANDEKGSKQLLEELKLAGFLD